MIFRDSVAGGLSRSISILENKENSQFFLEVPLRQIREVETALFDLISKINIETAEGDLLNKLGAIVGAYRNGRSDADFRDEINLNIAINTSDGTEEVLTNIIKQLTNSQNVTLQRDYPAGLIITVDGQNVTAGMSDKIQRAVAAGVSLVLNGTNGNSPLGLVSGATGQHGVAGGKGLADDGQPDGDAGFLVDGFSNTGQNSPILEGHVDAAELFKTPQLLATAFIEVFNNYSQYTPIFNARLAVVLSELPAGDRNAYENLVINYVETWEANKTTANLQNAEAVVQSIETSWDKIRYLTRLGIY